MPNEISRNEPLSGNWPETDAPGVSQRAKELGESAADAARTASAKVQSAGTAAVESLTGAASTVRQKAADYLGASAPRVQEFAEATAGRLSTTADYLRHSDATRMRADVETVVKNHPGPAMLVAAAFGFLLGRALSRE